MELQLPTIQDITKRNSVSGRFMKGHKPFNKGKKAKEYMSAKSYNKMISGLARNGNPNIGGCNRKSVVAIKDGKLLGAFSSSVQAAKVFNVWASNIRKVCKGERHHAGGYQFFIENDEEKWIKLLKN